MVGSQTVQGDHNAVAERDTTRAKANEDRAETEDWRSRLRKRGVIVPITTVVAAVVAVLTWLGWTLVVLISRS